MQHIKSEPVTVCSPAGHPEAARHADPAVATALPVAAVLAMTVVATMLAMLIMRTAIPVPSVRFIRAVVSVAAVVTGTVAGFTVLAAGRAAAGVAGHARRRGCALSRGIGKILLPPVQHHRDCLRTISGDARTRGRNLLPQPVDRVR